MSRGGWEQEKKILTSRGYNLEKVVTYMVTDYDHERRRVRATQWKISPGDLRGTFLAQEMWPVTPGTEKIISEISVPLARVQFPANGSNRRHTSLWIDDLCSIVHFWQVANHVGEQLTEAEVEAAGLKDKFVLARLVLEPFMQANSTAAMEMKLRLVVYPGPMTLVSEAAQKWRKNDDAAEELPCLITKNGRNRYTIVEVAMAEKQTEQVNFGVLPIIQTVTQDEQVPLPSRVQLAEELDGFLGDWQDFNVMTKIKVPLETIYKEQPYSIGERMFKPAYQWPRLSEAPVNEGKLNQV